MQATRRIWATAVLATVAATSIVATPAAASVPVPVSSADVDGFSAEVEPRRMVIGWEAQTPTEQRNAVLERHGLQLVESIPGAGADVVTIPTAALVDHVAAVQAEAGVAYAEPDFVVDAQVNDPGYPFLWGLHNTGQDGGTADVDIDAPEAWSTTRGSSEVVVAVIDSGVDTTHPDLAGRIWRNADEIAGNGIDDDGNGYVDDVNGWDFLNDDNTVFDSATADLHGTHVAGTIAATADNGIGVAGVAPGVRIMPLKFLADDGTGSSSAAAAAVAYARANGATVINASWGGGNSTTLRNAIAAATGVAVVAAAGNEGVDIDGGGTVPYPAGWAKVSYGITNVLSVASVDRNGARSPFSNYGADSVDIGAPGSSIASTIPGNAYGYLSGTSMAAPHASGVAALMASVDGSATGAELVSGIKAGAEPLASLATKTTTGGFLNAHASVQLASAAPPEDPVDDGDDPAPTDPVEDDPVELPAPDEGSGPRTLEHACPGVLGSGFLDVLSGSAHAPGVGCAAAWQVITGSSPGYFDPNTTLTRGQLASVLARAVERAAGQTLPTERDHFTDDQASVHRDAIDKLAAAGIVTGLTETTYGPGGPVTRGQFATMLGRAYRHLTGGLPSGADAFADDDGSLHEPAIDALAALGVVAGTADGRFQPNASLPRAQAATLVARLLDALVEAGAASAP